VRYPLRCEYLKQTERAAKKVHCISCMGDMRVAK
jgi:hypothetical protein